MTSGQKLVLLGGNRFNKWRAVRDPVRWEDGRGVGNKVVHWVGTVPRSDPQGPVRGFRTCPADNRRLSRVSGTESEHQVGPGRAAREEGGGERRAGRQHRHVSGEKSPGPDLERVTMVEKREEI